MFLSGSNKRTGWILSEEFRHSTEDNKGSWVRKIWIFGEDGVRHLRALSPRCFIMMMMMVMS